MSFDIEMAYREELWRYHGHREYLYGDDGEMQCSHRDCRTVWDYKRSDIEALAAHVQMLRILHASQK